MAATASRPSLASRIAETSGSPESRARKPSRASGSSSTINVISCIRSHDFPEGKFYGDDSPSAVAIFDFQNAILPVKLLQPCASVRQADALVCAWVAGGKTRSIVLNSKLYRS